MSRKRYRRYKKIIRVLRRPFEWIGILLAFLIIPFFTLKGCLRTASFMARLGMIFAEKDKDIARANLRIIFGNRITPYREKVLIYHAFRNMSLVLIQLFWISRHSKKRIDQLTVITPEFTKLLQQVRPSINISAHIGNWEVLAQAVVLKDVPMMTVAKEIGSPSMTNRLSRVRSSIGQKIVLTDGALKRLVHALRHDSSLGILIDQRTPIKEGGVWLNFFNLPAEVSIAPAMLSRKINVPIIIAWARPLKTGQYSIEYIKKLDPDPNVDDLVRSQEILSILEGLIRRHPSCWALNYRRWRSIYPGDDPARYPFYAQRKNKKRSQIEDLAQTNMKVA